MKKIKKLVIAAILTVGVFGYVKTGSTQTQPEFVQEFREKIEMRLGQMEANTIAYIVSQVEDHKEKERQRIEKELNEYYEKLAQDLAAKQTQEADKEIEKQKNEITQEYNIILADLKKSVEQMIKSH